MEACERHDCFACIYGKCFALWDTSDQEKCRFYRTDLNMRKINRELFGRRDLHHEGKIERKMGKD